MRLDWYLPALRKTADGKPAAQTGLSQLFRRCLPSFLRSNHETKQRGSVRRVLRWLGSSWLQSPARRVSQTICFATFVTLFFYVCWPYTTTPVAAGRVSTGWTLTSFDQQTGELLLHNVNIPTWIAQAPGPLYLVDAGPSELVGVFSARQIDKDTVSLAPVELKPGLVDGVLLASGEWELGNQPPNAWPSHYADDLSRKELIAADVFLILDPLVSISTAIASRKWIWSLTWGLGILVACCLVPRGFCGYICPLGTLIDLFDWTIGRQVRRFRVSAEGWWVHIKYFLLFGSVLCACYGVLVTGYVAAIPVITRGFLFVGEPIQTALMRGGHLVPPINSGAIFSILLFLAVLGLGFLQPRFWCKYVCPSGALFSIGNLFRVSERKVESSCIHCNKCIEVCPFDAIKPDFTTRVTDCTLCQTCGGVCPTHAIKFVDRGNVVELKLENDPPTNETPLGRRGFLSAAVGTAAAAGGAALLTAATKSFGASLATDPAWLPIRPPGSVPEQEFLQMCIRCGECFKACPNNVLQPLAFQQGLEGLWTPRVVADWAGCESSCNACGQVCPTGAIRALPLDEKRHARIGLALVNSETCLPLADREACQLCVDECNAAGYRAIEFTQVHTKTDSTGAPIEGTGYLAPLVLNDKCVGCGLCQTRCYGINVQERSVLRESAITIAAGEDREDRLFSGSYAALADERQRTVREGRAKPDGDFYVPAQDDSRPRELDDESNPFGI